MKHLLSLLGASLLCAAAHAAPDTPQFTSSGSVSFPYAGTLLGNELGRFAGPEQGLVLLFSGPGSSNNAPIKDAIPFQAIRIDSNGKPENISSRLIQGSPAAVHARTGVIADFNGDGTPDFFCANHGYDAGDFPGERQTLLLSGPDGKLHDASASLPPINLFAHSATAADLKRDGKIDILVGELGQQKNPGLDAKYQGENTIGEYVGPFILRNDGKGNFTYDNTSLPKRVAFGVDEQWQALDSPGRFTSSLFADVNGDGYPDLILGGDESNQVAGSLYLNDQQGKFKTTEKRLPVGLFGAGNTITVHLVALDADNDGCTDLILSQTDAKPNFYAHQRLQLLHNDCQGNFSDVTSSALPGQDGNGGWVQFVRPADLNGDGWTDLVLQINWPSNGQAHAWINQGNGSFRSTRLNGLPGDAANLMPGDINGDGLPDLIAVSTNTGTKTASATVYRNTYSATDSSDRVFNWAESAAAALFPGHASSFSANGYYARCYGNRCLGTKSGQTYYYDGKQLQPLGPLGQWLQQAR